MRSVEVDGQAVALARAGDTVDVVLAGVDSSALAVGALVCHPEWPVPVAARMEARIVVLDLPMPILKGRQVSMLALTVLVESPLADTLGLQSAPIHMKTACRDDMALRNMGPAPAWQ